ncbi:MAG: hypothetical protein LC663_01910 [Actinobacteria bacterium]|nr:hypothetical protein [Actinomycetota bacterium]
MRELIAGEGGSVLALGATRPDVVALACEGFGPQSRTPSGTVVFDAESIPDDIPVDVVRITACEPRTRARVTAWAQGRRIPWDDIAPDVLRKPAGIRVVGVSAHSTGSGKTALVRRVVRTLTRSGKSVAVARHPIASLLHWKRFDVSIVRTPDEARAPRPVDEREEIAPIVGARVVVATGLDPERVLAAAAREAGEGGVVVWDGGGAAVPWVECDLHLVAVDCLRPPEELRDADVYVLTKADTAGGTERTTRPLVPGGKPARTGMLPTLCWVASPAAPGPSQRSGSVAARWIRGRSPSVRSRTRCGPMRTSER